MYEGKPQDLLLLFSQETQGRGYAWRFSLFPMMKGKEKADEQIVFLESAFPEVLGSLQYVGGHTKTLCGRKKIVLGLFLNRVDALHAQHVLSQHHRNNNIYLANLPNQRITALGVASERRFDRSDAIAVAWLISWLTCSHDLLRA